MRQSGAKASAVNGRKRIIPLRFAYRKGLPSVNAKTGGR
jgi:hypothetical protein